MLMVVKLGGRILERGISTELVLDVTKMLPENKIVLVHGGGVEVTEVASKLGKKQEFVVSPGGFRSRYTDKETIDIYTMVMAGKINKQIVLALQSQGIQSIGLSGVDGSLLQAKRKKKLIVIDERGRKIVIDGGYTGTIDNVNAQLLWLLISNGYIPVIAPVAIGNEFEPLNVDGDRTAANIAGFLNADKLILLTNVQGLMLNGKLVPKIGVSKIREALSKIGHGMITKAYAAIEALESGVNEVIIASGLENQALSSALEHKCCTVISRE